LNSIEIIIDVKPFFGGSGIYYEGLLPGDKRVNRYYISIEGLLRIYLIKSHTNSHKCEYIINIVGGNDMREVLKLENISKIYQAKNGEIEALKDINFRVGEGEFVSIIGPSGCGKSTLLSIIAGLENKSSGKIYIDEIETEDVSSKIGYMLQKDSLLEWRTIYNNVIFGLEITHRKTKENEEYVKELLKKYNLYEFKDKYPTQLSGGMRQRVALIRTLAIRPEILLLDEAFSALDYQTRIMVTKDIYSILRNENITTVMVTHDISEAISMSDRVIVLSKRPAIVKKIHAIDFEMENRDPMNARKSPKFSNYFDSLWKELDVDAKEK